MFDTQIQRVTLVILIFQTLVLFAQLLFVFSRPNDRSRLRFLLLILAYIIYNLFAGLFPSEEFSISIMSQYILTFISCTALALYFIRYIETEFNIRPLKHSFFKAKRLGFTLSGAFVILFIFPYSVSGNLDRARSLFLIIPFFIGLAFLVKVTKTLIKFKFKDLEENSKLYRYRVISSYFGLFTLACLPTILLFANYQWLKVSVLNSGFVVMMITYIINLISQAQKEAIILSQISKKNQPIHEDMLIADDLIKDIVEKLRDFEDNQQYLKGKITIGILAKRFGTNSRYLSKIVNTYKGKSFTQYINDLRINYVKDRLKEDEKFRNYTLKAIALEIGYTRAEGFARAFYKSEQIKPSQYIKNIRDNQ